MKFTIANTQFSKKSDATEHFVSYFQGIWKRDEVLTDEDKCTLRNLLSARDDFEKDYIDQITDFRITTNKYGAFEIQYKCGEIWTAFSIARCIVGKPKTLKCKQGKILREAINDQIHDFRISNPIVKCSLCSCTTDIEVDHFTPLFSHLVADFLKSKNLSNDDPLTEEQILEFQTYHKANAKLRYLCKPHNLSEYTKIGRKTEMSKEEYLIRNRQNALRRYYDSKREKEANREAGEAKQIVCI